MCSAQSETHVSGAGLLIVIADGSRTIPNSLHLVYRPKMHTVPRVLHSLLHFSYPCVKDALLHDAMAVVANRLFGAILTVDTLCTLKCATGLILVWPGYLSHSRGYFGPWSTVQYCLLKRLSSDRSSLS